MRCRWKCSCACEEKHSLLAAPSRCVACACAHGERPEDWRAVKKWAGVLEAEVEEEEQKAVKQDLKLDLGREQDGDRQHGRDQRQDAWHILGDGS